MGGLLVLFCGQRKERPRGSGRRRQISYKQKSPTNSLANQAPYFDTLSTIFWKASGSRIANSDSILRSNLIPFLFN